MAPLKVNSYVFLLDRDTIVLGRGEQHSETCPLRDSYLTWITVLTMYTKGGGNAGAHVFVPEVDNIGPISFILAQTYEHAGGGHSAGCTQVLQQCSGYHDLPTSRR